MNIEIMKPKPYGYWTKERCHEVALKHNTRQAFQKNDVSAYFASWKKGWLGEVCAHMEEIRKMKGYWTKEKCAEVALKCKNRQEFQNIYGVPFKKAWMFGWLDEVCSHMQYGRKHNDYWTKETCHKAALKYKTRNAFRTGLQHVYVKALHNKWIDDICGHMIEVKKKEGYWTKEICAELASKCTSRVEFQRNHGSAYQTSVKGKWLDDICGHMNTKKIHPRGYWSIERCTEMALSCTSRREFQKKYQAAYSACQKKGWIDEVCAHMNRREYGGEFKTSY